MLAPGDILSTVRVLRALLAAYDTAGYVIADSFDAINPTAEEVASTLRPQLRDTANGLYELLEHLEAHPTYLAIRKEKLGL